MSYGFNCFLDGMRFVKLLLEWKMWNAMDGSVLHIAVNTNVALEVLRPTNKDERIVREEVLSIKTTQGIMNLMSGSIQ